MCVHVWCTEGGSQGLRDELRTRLTDAAPHVSVEDWTCMGFCPRGPHVVLYPQGTWYAGVQTTDMEEILAHLAGGDAVSRLTRETDPALHELLLNFMDACLVRKRTGLIGTD